MEMMSQEQELVLSGETSLAHFALAAYNWIEYFFSGRTVCR